MSSRNGWDMPEPFIKVIIMYSGLPWRSYSGEQCDIYAESESPWRL